MINCCKNCEKRHVGCHSDCQDYINEHNRDIEIRKKKQLDTEVNYAIGDIRSKRIRK